MLLKKTLGYVSVLAAATAMVLSAAKLPRPLADSKIQLPAADKPLRLIDTRGKIRVIVLMSSHCSDCKTALKIFNKVERAYRAKGVVFYGAAVDVNSARELTPFLVETQPSFPVGTMTQYDTQMAADFTAMERPFVPIVLFVDKTNHVKFQFTGDTDFFKDQENRTKGVLETMLKQQ